jgi:6-phosphogluconolactonase
MAPAMSDTFVYFGTYTGPHSRGIYVARLDPATGHLTPPVLAAESPNPGFLAVHPNHRLLYTTNEINDFAGSHSGSVSAFAIDRRTGKLTFLNAVASGDPGPCHLAVDHTGNYVLVANYAVGSVAAFRLGPDGRLGERTAFHRHTGHGINSHRQEAPHAHSIYVSPDNRFVVSAELGTDQVFIYRFDATKGTLTPNDPPTVAVPAGSGPRHFAFDPAGKFAYVIEEMGSSLTAFSWDAAAGILRPLETISTKPPDYTGYNDCAELLIHPSGKFLYGSNRGHNSITVFALDPATGKPTPIQYAATEGKTPRGFGIDPTGSYLIAGNQDTNTVVEFRIDHQTGRLTLTGQKFDLSSPVCVVFVPAE